MNTISQVAVGIDISKDTLDIYVNQTREGFSCANNAKGFKQLIKRLSRYQVSQVVYESTGGYEYLLSKVLKDRGYKQWQVDPKRIRAFIISEGIRAKTDKIDAEMIALFAAQKQCKYSKEQRSDQHDLLVALTKRRASLVKIAAEEKNRLRHPGHVYCKERITNLIALLELEIKAIEKEITQLIKKNDDWERKKSIIKSMPGMGDVCSSVLIGSLSELGKVNDKEIAALVGVAPYIQQSGTMKGKAAIRGGRYFVRDALYMACHTAIRFNKRLKEFYDRLCHEKKCFKVAITAVMRKIIVILNAMVRNNETWRDA